MRRRWPWLVLLVVAGALVVPLALAGGSAHSSSDCTTVNGHLLDEHVTANGSVGRMIGGINGDYVFTNQGSVGIDPTLPVNFGYGAATIETNKGTLLWHEDSALDLVNEDAYSTVVLATVTGGTGAWAGAHGHVTMSGYFHASTLTGEFDYRGSVCTGPATQMTP